MPPAPGRSIEELRGMSFEDMTAAEQVFYFEAHGFDPVGARRRRAVEEAQESKGAEEQEGKEDAPPKVVPSNLHLAEWNKRTQLRFPRMTGAIWQTEFIKIAQESYKVWFTILPLGVDTPTSKIAPKKEAKRPAAV